MDAPAGRRRAARPVQFALLAALMLFPLAGVVRNSAGGPPAAQTRVPAFKYNYRVLEVELYGLFDTTINDEGSTFSGRETIIVRGLAKGGGVPPRLWSEFSEGTLTLQSPPSDIRVNGMLKTSDFKRIFKIKGAGVDADGKNFSCGESSIDDFGGFVGAMRLSGSEKVKVHWVLPGVPYKCGPVTVDYNDQHRLRPIEGDPSISTADDPKQEAQTYPLSVFRQQRFKLEINIAHSWEPDYATKAEVLWWGEVLLERIDSGKGKK